MNNDEHDSLYYVINIDGLICVIMDNCASSYYIRYASNII